MKYVTTALLSTTAMLLVACAQSSETVRHGSATFLLTQTQNQWADNVILVTPCKAALVNGQCDPDGPTQVSTASGKLPGVVGGAGGTVAGALILRDGLVKGKPKVNNSNTTNEHFSTKYIGK